MFYQGMKHPPEFDNCMRVDVVDDVVNEVQRGRLEKSCELEELEKCLHGKILRKSFLSTVRTTFLYFLTKIDTKWKYLLLFCFHVEVVHTICNSGEHILVHGSNKKIC